jgi:membrane-bound lytic murein transglycosylase F
MSTPLVRRAEIGVGAALAVLAFAAVAQADLDEIRRAKVVRVLVVDGTPELFSKAKSPRQPGLEREILQSFGFRQDVNLEIRAFSSVSGVFQALRRGEGDIAAGGLRANDTPDVVFSAEVLPSRHVIVTWKRAKPIQTLEELRDETIGMVRGTTLSDAVSGEVLARNQWDDSFAPGTLLAALKAGKVTACILSVESAIPAQAADPDVQLGMYVGPKFSLAFALRKDAPALVDALNEYVANLRRTATWNRLVLKYFGDSAIDILKASR